MERLIAAARKRHPSWGARKLVPYLARQHPDVVFPAESTVSSILERSGLVEPRRRQKRAAPSAKPLSHTAAPNALWCCDFKGWFRTKDGVRRDPLTVADAYSRFALVCKELARPIHRLVQPCFERAFKEYGLPDGISSDNGRHERFHRTLKQETARPPQATARAQQAAFTRFVREYNEERPQR